MKEIYRDVILAVILSALVPALLLSISSDSNRTEEPVETTVEFMNQETENQKPSKQTVTLLETSGTVTEIELQEYVLNVILKEMPASFESEALKAQAVVARTYAVKRNEGNPKHPESNLCTNPQCCQGYCTVEEYLNQGGDIDNVEKIRSAVEDTVDEVITYQGTLIDATYFSCSGGLTEDAQAVWGKDVPYLQSVESPGEENAAHYTDTVSIPFDDFQFLLGQRLNDEPDLWIKSVSYTQGKGVDQITLGDVTYTGTDFRRKLGLRSTAFEISIANNTVIIKTKGYGHRVGMSQYGANVMAAEGHNYREILMHYYTGTEIATYLHND